MTPSMRRRVEVAAGGGRSGSVPTSLFWLGILIALGLGFCFEWEPIVMHQSAWLTSSDLWGVFRAAHYVGWGDIGGIYDPSLSILTLPGFFVLMAPVAMLSGALGLTESSPAIFLAHPSADFLLVPFELLCGAPVIFLANCFVREQTTGRARRNVVMALVTLLVFSVCGVWGHAEDALALGAGLFALRLTDKGKVGLAAWVMGMGIAVQPLVAVVLPLVFALAPAGRRLGVLLRAGTPALGLVALSLLSNFQDARRGIFGQTEAAAVNHPTPWVALAPVVDRSQRIRVLVVHVGAQADGAFRVHQSIVSHLTSSVVSAGPFRDAAMVGALLLGLLCWRWRPGPKGVLWLCAVALAFRCYVEPVMIPYFLVPPMLVGVLSAAGAGRRRFGLALVSAVAGSLFAYLRLSPWAWWLPVVAMVTVVLWCGYPGRAQLSLPARRHRDRHGRGSPEVPVGSDVPAKKESEVTVVDGIRDEVFEPVMASGGDELAGVGSLSEAWQLAMVAPVSEGSPPSGPNRFKRSLARAEAVLRWALGTPESERPEGVLALGDPLP